jgi:opacity protein-like surface antigen
MRHIILLAVIIVLAAVPAFSQDMPGKFEVTAQGGVNKPTGDFGEISNLGYSFGATAGYKLPMNKIVVGAEIMYYGNGATDEMLAALGVGSDMSTNIIQFSAMGKFMFPMMEVHNVYAKATVGAYNFTTKLEMPSTPSVSGSTTNFGGSLGGGVRINGSSKASFFAEGNYHHITSDGGSAQFLAFSAGVLFTLP